MNVVAKLFICFFWAIFILESLGLPNGRLISFWLILTAPLILVLISLLLRDKYFFPEKLTLTYLLFLSFSVFSLFQPYDFPDALNGISYFISLFLISVITYSYKKQLIKPLMKSIIIFAFLLPVYSVFARNFLYPRFPFLIPDSGYQLVLAKFGLHSHMGDFLSVIFVGLIYLFLQKPSPKFLIVALILTPYLIFSYSRSALFSFMTVSTILITTNRNLLRNTSLFSKIVFGIILLSCLIFFTLSIREINLTSDFGIKTKVLWTNRLVYFSQALKSIMRQPFGIGFNNFQYASDRFSAPNQISAHSSHNLLIDIFTEQGALAGVCFLIFIYHAFKLSEKKIFFYIFLTLLINFQTDYSHRIYFMMLLFYISLGLIYNPDRSVK